MIESNKHAPHTYVIADIIRHLSTAEMKSQVLSKEVKIKGTAKDAINRVAIKSRSAIKEIYDLLSPSSKKLVDDDLADPEVFPQIDQVVAAMYVLPKGVRDEIESYVMARKSLYQLNNND